MSHIRLRLSGSFSKKTSANSSNFKTAVGGIYSWKSSVTSLTTRTTIIDPLAISLLIIFKLISIEAFMLLDASVYLVSGKRAGRSGASLIFFPS